LGAEEHLSMPRFNFLLWVSKTYDFYKNDHQYDFLSLFLIDCLLYDISKLKNTYVLFDFSNFYVFSQGIFHFWV
jgi:hypothetical protein